MARIRTIKPEFFKHEELFDLERETGLPIRVAFIGLWTAADKDGRFKWRPRQLGVDILPYDDVDFAVTLSSLHSHGFIQRYEVDGEQYGYIVNWHKHQRPRGDEKDSGIPAPSDGNETPYAAVTKPSRRSDETVATKCIGNREEGIGKREVEEGKERKGERAAHVVAVFDHYRTYHPRANKTPRSTSKEWRAVKARLEDGFTVADLCQAIDGCHKTPHNLGANERGQKYLGLELIMRTGDQVTRFMENAEKPPVPQNEKERRTLDAAARWLEEEQARDAER